VKRLVRISLPALRRPQHASRRGSRSGGVSPLERRAPVCASITGGLGHPLPESVRHRPTRVRELRRTHAVRRSDRGCRPGTQRAAPSPPAGRAAAVGSSASARLGRLSSDQPFGVRPPALIERQAAERVLWIRSAWLRGASEGEGKYFAVGRLCSLDQGQKARTDLEFLAARSVCQCNTAAAPSRPTPSPSFLSSLGRVS